MHEYSVASALLRMVEEQAAQHAASRVLCVHVRVGELAGVEPELLASAWELVRECSSCEGAELALRRVPLAWVCPRCGSPTPAGHALRCAHCDVPARLAGGDDLILERIEMEVD